MRQLRHSANQYYADVVSRNGSWVNDGIGSNCAVNVIRFRSIATWLLSSQLSIMSSIGSGDSCMPDAMLMRYYGAHAVIRQRDELMTWLQLFTKTLNGKSASGETTHGSHCGDGLNVDMHEIILQRGEHVC